MPEYCNAKAEKEHLEEKINDERKELKDAILAYEKARKAFFDFPPRWIPLTVYWLIFGFVAVGEGFFNYFVFQIFGQEITETFLMAVAIILVLLVTSELVGIILRKKINQT